MFRLMRNIHLGLGLIFVLMAMIFAISSLVFIYRPWFKPNPTVTESTIPLSLGSDANARSVARALMTDHGMKGELRQIKENGDAISFRIVRPGEVSDIKYDLAQGQAKVKVTRQNALETMVALHTNHGLWHDYLPSNLWSAISLFTSAGLILLGLTGIYLWFAHHSERLIGGILLGSGLVFGLVTLILTRMEQ